MLDQRLRELRRSLGMTLAQVSQKSGISVAMISQVERGQVDPSLESLRRLAQTLNVPMFELFRPPDTAPVAITRSGERRQITSAGNGVTYELVSRLGGRIEVLEGTLDSGAASSPEMREHNAEECVVVREGVLTVEVGLEVVELSTGDSCHFESTIAHRYVNLGDRTARFTVSVTPPSL